MSGWGQPHEPRHPVIDETFVDKAARKIVEELRESRTTIMRDLADRSPEEQDAALERVRAILRGEA